MKKFLLVFTFFAISQLSVSQKKTPNKVVSSNTLPTSTKSGGEGFENGDWFISGKLGYTSEEKGGINTSTLGILPSVGYFIGDKLALLGSLGFENKISGSVSNDSFVAGAALRYYTTPSSKFSLFGQGGVTFKSVGSSVTIFEIGLKPGLNYFISNNFSLESTFGNVGIVSNDGNTDFNFGINMSEIG